MRWSCRSASLAFGPKVTTSSASLQGPRLSFKCATFMIKHKRFPRRPECRILRHLREVGHTVRMRRARTAAVPLTERPSRPVRIGRQAAIATKFGRLSKSEPLKRIVASHQWVGLQRVR